MWIKPVVTSGMAGGQKFVLGKVCRHQRCRSPCPPRHCGDMVHTQVFYKFATTAGGIYPSDAAAHKAAALEITAMNAVVGSNNTQITVTLTALFLVCGHCVIATAKAPLRGSESLIYGSDNAGHKDRVVHDGRRCPAAVPIIRRLASTLGLAEHPVLDGYCTLSLPIDAEVHLGDDGRLYLIDLARLDPPVPPPASDAKNSWLFQHFRPELLLRHRQLALSSDVFSPFASGPRDRKRDFEDLGACVSVCACLVWR